MHNIEDMPSSMRKALALHNSLARSQEPKSTEEATLVQILDANYKKADLQAVVMDNCSHLSSKDKDKLLELLKELESLFDGTLGAWKTMPVTFQLKEGVKPYDSRAFPIPVVNKEMITKKIKCLCRLGVLKWQPSSEWAVPSFIQPKKNKTVHFLSDFRELNKRLVRKPFPLPKLALFCKS